MRVLHAIHDFLPAHRAGSEIYALNLCRELARRHDVRVLCAEYDGARPHASVTRRTYEGLPVVEVVNNWRFRSFRETWESPELGRVLAGILAEERPDILHLHSALNLSFELPALARAVGARCVATLHDYTLFCASGGQRVHVAERHVCDEIDTSRCARCFRESPFFRQMTLASVSSAPGRPSLTHLLERLRGLSMPPNVSPAELDERLAAVRRLAEDVDLFVAPSAALGAEVVRLGLPAAKVRVSDYGFPPLARSPRTTSPRLRIGFVGTLVWHKGAHVLLEAARSLPKDRYEVLLFGNVDWFPSYVSRLRTLADGLPVRFMGSFGGDPGRVYSQLDVLVVPSLWPENSPLVIHEAFQSGVPVVGADVGGIPELLGNGRAGRIYPATSAPSLASVLRELLEAPKSLEELSRALPAVKDIASDADFWDGVYRGLA